MALGAILAAGHDLSVLDRWSWDEVALVAESITAYHASVLTMVLGGLYEGKGKPKRGAKSKSTRTTLNRDDPEAMQRARERDAKIMFVANQMGALDG